MTIPFPLTIKVWIPLERMFLAAYYWAETARFPVPVFFILEVKQEPFFI